MNTCISSSLINSIDGVYEKMTIPIWIGKTYLQ